MATDTEHKQQLEQLQVDLPNEEPAPLYRSLIKWDNKLIWLAISIAVVYFATRASRSLTLLVVLTMALLVLNILLFWAPLFDGFRTTLSAWLFRTGAHQARESLGKNFERSEEMAAGHIAIHDASSDRSGTEPIPYPELKRAYLNRRVRLPKGVGKTSFYPTDVGQASPMGWVWHPGSKSWVVTAATEWYPWDPAFLAVQKGRLEGLARLCDVLALSSNSMSRLVLQDRTIIGERVDYDRDVKPFVDDRRKRSRYSSETSNNSDLRGEVAELADEGTRHETSLTVAIGHRKWTGSQAPVEVLRQYEEFCKQALGRKVGLQQLWPLSHNQLVYEFLKALDPEFVSRNWSLLEKWVEREELLDPGIIAPPTDKEDLKCYRVGETWHSTWIVEEFGRKGKMAPNDLWAIVGERVPKTVTTVINIVPFGWAKKMAVMSTTAVRSRNIAKEESGSRTTDFDLVEVERRQQSEHALARGHGMQSRSHTYIDFTGPSEEVVSANAAAVAAVASNKDIMLRPLTGDQRIGLGAAVPLALGLEGGNVALRVTSALQSR